MQGLLKTATISNNTLGMEQTPQKWHFVPTTAGYKLVSAINPNYVLDLSGANTRNGTNIQIYQNNNTKAQSWIFQELINEVAYLDKLASQNKNTLENGVYLIRNTGTGKYLTVSNSSNSNGANIEVTSTSNQETQKWKVEHDSIGYVTLINMNSGRVLDISGASKVNGTNIQQYDSNNTRAQKWVTIKNGGALQLISALSSTLRMSVHGSNVDSEKNKGTSADQAWTFTKTTSIREEASNLASKIKEPLQMDITSFIQQSMINSFSILQGPKQKRRQFTNLHLEWNKRATL